jgi:hypothetical protein
MDSNEESLDSQWQRIDARTDKAARDLANVEKKLDALKSDVEFWEIVLELNGKASK